MKEYLVSFKPVGPFFFGNEKGFAFSEEDVQRYFIKSDDMPSQSTVLGTLRYMLLPVKKSDWKYSEEEKTANRNAIGARGFDPESADADYGIINKVSPLFILARGEITVATPFDHIDGNGYYTPFTNYCKDAFDVDGRIKYYTEDYSSKDGVTSSFMRVSDGKIIARNEIFISDIRPGLNLDIEGTSFHKREYKRLADGHAFGVFVTLDSDSVPESSVVYMGQGKSAFYVTFTEQKNTLYSAIASHIRNDVVYCASDVFAEPRICDDTFFAVTDIKTYRHFCAEGGNVKKGSMLYRLIKAGSIFIPRDKDKFIADLSDKALTKVGYNTLIFRKEDRI